VHDGIHAGEDAVEFRLVADITFHQLKTLSELPKPGREVVVDDDTITGAPQSTRSVTANVTCASNYENGQE
jgi:hypothetical protein